MFIDGCFDNPPFPPSIIRPRRQPAGLARIDYACANSAHHHPVFCRRFWLDRAFNWGRPLPCSSVITSFPPLARLLLSFLFPLSSLSVSYASLQSRRLPLSFARRLVDPHCLCESTSAGRPTSFSSFSHVDHHRNRHGDTCVDRRLDCQGNHRRRRHVHQPRDAAIGRARRRKPHRIQCQQPHPAVHRPDGHYYHLLSPARLPTEIPWPAARHRRSHRWHPSWSIRPDAHPGFPRQHLSHQQHAGSQQRRQSWSDPVPLPDGSGSMSRPFLFNALYCATTNTKLS